jgi:SagB-type dehydrogenase family enzyme
MSAARALPTVNLAAPVYGNELEAADPAELLHEASKLQPSQVRRQMRGVWKLAGNEALQASTTRAVRRHPGRPRIRLPQTPLPAAPLGASLRRRRSAQEFGSAPLWLAQLAVLLRAGYGVVPQADPAEGAPPRRTAPSAGALYPLELFVAARSVVGLDAGVYHYDPLDDELEVLPGTGDLDLVATDQALVEAAAAVLFVAAVFWRSRVKYGLRAYRFTLLEAGHVTQNVLLAATALDLASTVLGGFYDARADALLGLDGLHESTLVGVCLGAQRR